MLELPLAVYLLAVMPAQQMWRSLRKPRQAAPLSPPRHALYWSMTARLAAMLAVLAATSCYLGRTCADLGLGWPMGAAARWGIALALVLVAVLHSVAEWQERRMDAAARAGLEAGLEEGLSPPRTAGELAAFLVMCVALGAGWEILYRGFLLLVLTPHVGTVGAVCIAALAYGIGHGFATPRQFAGSIVSAFAFTGAYTLTGGLWWLIVIHIGAPAGMGMGAWLRHRRKGVSDAWLAAPPP